MNEFMLYEVILDSGETANKCTIAPLRYRPDFKIFSTQGRSIGPLSSPLLLHHQGQCITQLRSSLLLSSNAPILGFATIDCVWKRLDLILSKLAPPQPVWVKIPDGFQTAYPRRSSLYSDPESGLATIEAIFVASALLGRWDITLFSEYYFGRKFIEINQQLFLDFGIQEAKHLGLLPTLAPKVKNSRQRRLDRGRFRP